MARPLRFEYAGAVYHVMARGDGGKAIFIAKDDQGAGQIYSRSEDFLVLRIFFVALVYVNTYIRPV